MSVPRFESSELQQALASVGWGLQAWELLPEHFCPQNEARAKVELLEEGDTVRRALLRAHSSSIDTRCRLW